MKRKKGLGSALDPLGTGPQTPLISLGDNEIGVWGRGPSGVQGQSPWPYLTAPLQRQLGLNYVGLVFHAVQRETKVAGEG